MKVRFENVDVVGCEVELDERDPTMPKKMLKVDFGNGIGTRFGLNDPGVELIGVGVKVTGEVELSSSGIRFWSIPSDTDGQAPRTGHSLSGLVIKSVSDGEKTIEVKPSIEKRDWNAVEPTRKRQAFQPRGAQTGKGGAAQGKTGGEREEEETVSDTPE